MKQPFKDTLSAQESRQQRTICLLTRQKRYEERERLHLYTDYLCHLLSGRIQHITVVDAESADSYFFDQKQPACDLTVFGEPDRSLLKRLLVGQYDTSVIRKVHTSLLVAREPRWPIRRILLPIRFEESDNKALDWLTLIATPAETMVTLLPLIASGSELWVDSMRLPKPAATLVVPNTRAGRQLQQISQQLDLLAIKHEVHFQEGTAVEQARREIGKGDYDLVIIGGDPPGQMRRWLLGELVTPLLQSINRPILIAKAVQPQ